MVNKNLKNNIIKIIILIIISLFVGFLAEICFNINLLMTDKNFTSMDLSKAQITDAKYDNGRIICDGDDIKISIDIPEQYVERLDFQYQNTSDEELTVFFYVTTKNGYDKIEEKQLIYTSNNIVTQTNLSVREKISNIRIEMGKSTGKTITKVSIDNRFIFNILRFGFFVALTFIITFIILFRKLISKKLEIGFLVISIVAGSCMIMLQPITYNSWDSQVHFQNAYTNSFLGEVQQTKSPIYIKNMLIENQPGNSYLERRNWIGYSNVNNVKFEKEKEFLHKKPNVNVVSYISESVGLFIGRTLKLPFYLTFLLGQFFNLLQYSVIMYFAIKYMIKWKTLMFSIGLLPTAVFLASNYSYDPFINATVMLYFSLFVGEYFRPENKIKLSKLIFMVILIVVASLPKMVYIPLLLLLLLLPKEKFNFKRKNIYLIVLSGFVLFVALIMINPLLGVTYSGDVRGGDVSSIEQIKSIITHPFSYFNTLFVDNIFGKFAEFILHDSLMASFAYLGTHTASWFTVIILILFLTFTDNYNYSRNELKITKFSIKTKIFMGIILLMVMSLIWTSLYVAFTPVGTEGINGVQARYYMPIIIMIYLLFNTDKIKCTIKQQNYSILAISVSTYILFDSIYNQMLLKYVM